MAMHIGLLDQCHKNSNSVNGESASPSGANEVRLETRKTAAKRRLPSNLCGLKSDSGCAATAQTRAPNNIPAARPGASLFADKPHRLQQKSRAASMSDCTKNTSACGLGGISRPVIYGKQNLAYRLGLFVHARWIASKVDRNSRAAKHPRLAVILHVLCVIRSPAAQTRYAQPAKGKHALSRFADMLFLDGTHCPPTLRLSTWK